ncbi:MAG: SprT family zinc-dependent metalloprotease [Patescibacteria group bacterium]
MQKQIVLQDRTVDYTLRKSRRARRVRLAVHADGRVAVVIPFFFKEIRAERFLREKSTWLFSKIAFFQQFHVRATARQSAEEYVRYRDVAYQLAVERARYFSAFYGFNFNRITIKRQRTRWGSCSKIGNLNFHYKIALLPPHLADYIIVHELCHLKEFNHSCNFWKKVGEIMPDYLNARRELKNCMMHLM